MQDPKEFLRSLGVEVRSDGRRIWPKKAKAYIVAETLKPGATVKAVADEFGVCANHLSEWRGLAKNGKLVLPAPDPDDHVEFAPVVFCGAGEASAQPQVSPPSPPAEKVEIVFRGVSIKLSGDTAAPRIAEVARAVGGLE